VLLDIERLPDPDPDHHGTTDVTTATAEVAIVVTVTDVTMVAVVRGVVKHHLTGVKQHSVINAVVITLIITIVNGNMNQNHLNQHHNSNSKITDTSDGIAPVTIVVTINGLTITTKMITQYKDQLPQAGNNELAAAFTKPHRHHRLIISHQLVAVVRKKLQLFVIIYKHQFGQANGIAMTTMNQLLCLIKMEIT